MKNKEDNEIRNNSYLKEFLLKLNEDQDKMKIDFNNASILFLKI